jgi:pyruvate-ferredoxin/flavodoxin oxidoreductase
MANGLDQQKLAVETGCWPLFRHNPARSADGIATTVLDSAPPKHPLSTYTRNELRYQALHQSNPDRARELAGRAQEAVNRRFAHYQYLAGEGPAPTVVPAVPPVALAKPAPAP